MLLDSPSAARIHNMLILMAGTIVNVPSKTPLDVPSYEYRVSGRRIREVSKTQVIIRSRILSRFKLIQVLRLRIISRFKVIAQPLQQTKEQFIQTQTDRLRQQKISKLKQLKAILEVLDILEEIDVIDMQIESLQGNIDEQQTTTRTQPN